MKKMFTFLKKLGFCFVVLWLAACSSQEHPGKITLEEARQQFEAGQVSLVDIRETSEHQTGVAQGAVLLPMSQLSKNPSLISNSPEKPILLICNTQNRSKATLEKLNALGYQNIRYVDGGMSQWAARGWPMVKPN
ncbi:MAG: putative adenylyltransferase/sulfurtransferase MoeZ [Pseudomonadota bacterium]|jgi:rhodanese-related sulfurtransferase